MRKPFIKTILSYFLEQHIETRSSSLNPELHVSLVDGRYQLCTQNAIYSFEDKYANFTRAFKRLAFDRISIKKVLILGFGMGSIPFILEKTFNKKYDYTGIELDEEVIALASRYLIPNMKSKIDLVLGDAFQFVINTSDHFDLIAVDIFQDATIPKEFEHLDFLETLKNIMTQNGILMYNRLFHSKTDEEATREYYENIFIVAFPDGEYISVGGNWILINDRNLLL